VALEIAGHVSAERAQGVRRHGRTGGQRRRHLLLGHGYGLPLAKAAVAQVRLRKVREFAPDEAIASNEGWAAHAAATQHIVEASREDLKWAEAFLFGTRSENLSDSLSLFLLHRPVPTVARWSYLVSTGVLRLLRGELPGDVEMS